MKLSDYVRTERGSARTLADKLGMSPSRLSQVIKDSSSTSPAVCVLIEKATGCAVMRWELRAADWHLIWPELIGTDGAPDAPQEAQAA